MEQTNHFFVKKRSAIKNVATEIIIVIIKTISDEIV